MFAQKSIRITETRRAESSKLRARQDEVSVFTLSLKGYKQLDIDAALRTRETYLDGVAELSAVLQACYRQSGKPVQHLMFEHTCAALGDIERLGEPSCRQAVAELSRTAQDVLPQAKRRSVSSCHKAAALSLHRRDKRLEEKEQRQVDQETAGSALTLDTLELVLCHLEAPHLARCACVSRQWLQASRHEDIWRRQYCNTFGSKMARWVACASTEAELEAPTARPGGASSEGAQLAEPREEARGAAGTGSGARPESHREEPLLRRSDADGTDMDALKGLTWYSAFLLARRRDPLRVPTRNRALCRKCGTLIWRTLPNLTRHLCSHGEAFVEGFPEMARWGRVIPLSAIQVMDYLRNKALEEADDLI
ncbi:hypothetical protein CYMTET_10595 [Cymbomonas tetramitiformis]|uniref:F-box domain-containing protein n=1 Tax=Cymbomonas tetramitiformis TaxID=36881 RepID=A0AAE0GPF1_9CHLO|nr:hypothetical protein CYMTET_10595 [Cymbomonas tetramitiformis]